MLLLKNVVPELNLWFGNTLLNNDLNIVHFDYPVKLSQKWRCRDSVIDLLFNECYDPSGKLYNGHHFITKYKTVNLDRVYPYDPALYRRIQTIKNRCYIFAADDPDNQELQESFNKVTPSFVIDTSENVDTIAQRVGVSPTKYVTKYDGEIITSSTDQLHCELPDKQDDDPDPEPGIYTPSEDIFHFTQEELEMLEFLHYYRTGQFELICCFPHDFYFSLRSPLSKWIYLYLQCYLFNIVNYEYFNSITQKSDGLLRCIFEKFAQDRIYKYIEKQYFTIWNQIDNIGGELYRKFEDHTMPCHTFVWRKRIFSSDLKCKQIPIILEEENQPVENVNFEFIYDGIILKQGIDYDVVNKGTLKDTRTYVILKDVSKFKVDSKYQLMWSALILTTPMTREFYFANAYGTTGDRRVINMYCNDCGDGCSRYGQDYGKNRPRPVLIEEMIDLHNKDKLAHPELLKEIDKITALIMDHIYQINNPHNVTKEQVGLGNVDNTSDADKPLSNIAKQEIESIKTRLTKAEKDIKELDQELDDRVEKKVDKIFNEEQFIINGDNDNF